MFSLHLQVAFRPYPKKNINIIQIYKKKFNSLQEKTVSDGM